VRELKVLDEAEWNARWQQELAERDKTFVVPTPMVSKAVAQKAMDNGQATWQDHFVLLLDAYRLEQWDIVLKHLESVESLVPDKPGLMWVRHHVGQKSR
jgi:hypothetical protein